MKKVLFAILIGVFSTSVTQAQFAGGSGTEEDPYQVETAEQLQEIRNHADKHFIQMNDIDADDTSNWNGGDGFEPVGDDVVKFTGVYDGKGYKIENLHIHRHEDNYVGLFAMTENSLIKNVSLVSVSIYGEGNVGSLVGLNEGRVDNSSVNGGGVGGQYSLGALIGTNRGLVENSSAVFPGIHVQSHWGSEIGGLVGYNRNGTIHNSHSINSITSIGSYVGGLVGRNMEGVISHSYATGSINNVSHNDQRAIGGLVGSHREGTIEHCWADMDITGDNINSVGGLIGSVASDDYRSTIKHSHATGDVSGVDGVGGLIGYAGSLVNITHSFATGEVTGHNDVGGLVGSVGSDGRDGIVEQVYATGNVSGNVYVGGLIGTLRGEDEDDEDGPAILRYGYATGSVTGDEIVGGLVGRNQNGLIEASYAHGDVSGNIEVGGLVGVSSRTNSTISETYAIGAVAGDEDTGGLIGVNGADLTSSYWNTELSGKDQAVGRGADGTATGLTTSEMQLQGSYSGWDFETIWEIEEGEGYPAIREDIDDDTSTEPAIPDIGDIELDDENWVVQHISENIIADIHFIDEMNGWAVGDNGAILRTTNGGQDWTEEIHETESLLYNIHVTDEDHGWITGSQGILLQLSDGEETWTDRTTGTSEDLIALHFVDHNIGWIGGGSFPAIARFTEDGGESWSDVELDIDIISSIHFYDTDNGWIVGNEIWHTANGGETWTSQSDHINGFDGELDVRSVYATSAENVWAAGVSYENDGDEETFIIHTSDGGQTWQVHDSGVNNDFEFSWLEDVHFVDEHTGTAVGYGYNNGESYGFILSTGDSGKTWSKLVLSEPETGFYTVFFTEEGNGWAAGSIGDNGIILNYETDDDSVTSSDTRSFVDVPDKFNLNQNYPNPFNPATVISYQLPEVSEVRLEVFDLLGRRVAALVDGTMEAGRHTANFDASQLAGGVYIYRLNAGDFVQTRKMMLVK